eukprot:5099709-Pleurochrysis_carterae.AAC.1
MLEWILTTYDEQAMAYTGNGILGAKDLDTLGTNCVALLAVDSCLDWLAMLILLGRVQVLVRSVRLVPKRNC